MRTPTKRSLISSHSHLNAELLLALPFPACIFDPGSNIVFYSNSFFNYENAVQLVSLLEKWDYRFLTDNDLKILNHRVKIENKISTRRLCYKGSQVKSVEVHLSVIPGESMVLFFFTDVWTQESVFSKTTYIEELVQGISEGIALINDANMVTYCNRSFAKFFNRTEDFVIGTNLCTITDTSVAQILNSEFENLRKFNESNFEIQLKSNLGADIFILIHAIPRKSNDGKYSGALFTLMDITERVVIERELVLAKEKALDADRLKSTFLANISHEIRTPMNSIIGFSSMLKRSGLDRKKREQYLDIINSRGKHLMDILNNIIDISKLEENLIQLNYEECNLVHLFDELMEFYTDELIKNNKEHIHLKISNDCEPQKQIIISDALRLNQILTNLLNNAVKFTEAGYIEAGFKYLNDENLLFFVQDTGIGIPPDKQEIIFERFRQVDESFTRTYGGTGLGLSICKGFLKLMNGKIWVESDGINGSTFYFSIPVIKFEKGEKINPELSSMGEKSYDWKGRKILIIEDDPTSFEFLAEVLQPTQCIIKHANNGIDALDCFNSDVFDLILLDIQLPEMDGYQIATTIRKNNPNIPIIAQTAHAMSDDKQKCFNAGCNEYLTKPVHFEQLLDTINSFFLS